MSLWTILWVVVGAGAVGGAVNALLSDNGFPLPQREKGIWRPGFLGNVFIGSVSALISWGLYGPYAQSELIGGTTTKPAAVTFALTLSAFVGALLVGIAGSRWLTNEVDKNLLRSAGAEAVNAKPKIDLSQALLMATPSEALNAAVDAEKI